MEIRENGQTDSGASRTKYLHPEDAEKGIVVRLTSSKHGRHHIHTETAQIRRDGQEGCREAQTITYLLKSKNHLGGQFYLAKVSRTRTI